MRIQLKKGKDGPSTLACVRADGSRTWSKLHPFFPAHDLTHCAVESVLGFDEAFFGLVASGWRIDDFSGPGAARRMPEQAVVAESIVGLFDQERGAGGAMAPDEFNAALAQSLTTHGISFRTITSVELAHVRTVRSDLIGRWFGLEMSGTLEVPFPYVAERADA